MIILLCHLNLGDIGLQKTDKHRSCLSEETLDVILCIVITYQNHAGHLFIIPTRICKLTHHI